MAEKLTAHSPWIMAVWMIALVLGSVKAGTQQPAQQEPVKPPTADKTPTPDEDIPRQIVAEDFIKTRPARPASKSQSSRQTPATRSGRAARSTGNLLRRPKYRRASHPQSVAHKASGPDASEYAQVGVTIWRLRQTTAADTGPRLLVQESASETRLTPERAEADTPLHIGDRVRLSIESPRTGYLYVIDREQYADGSQSDPYLVFPTTRTRGGNNQVKAGLLIDIPAQDDRPNYFTLKPSRSDQVGEILSIIVTTQPLEDLVITDRPLKLSKEQVALWQRTWGTQVERYEMEGGAGKTWTKEEQAASADSGRYLTQEEPSPQTIYRVGVKRGSPLLVTVPLRYGDTNVQN